MRTCGRFLLLAGALTGACASAPTVSPVRFANQPAITVVDDRRDVPRPPAERPYYREFYHFDSFYLMSKRGFDLERARRALGVNALDEVPDSTWFTNRIGVREVTPDEIRTGSAPRGNPDQHLPWTIKSSKTGGTTIGFVVEDARGVRFLLKFDRPYAPEVETAPDAIVSRILWACGFNVPENHVVYFRRQDLRVAPGATTRDRNDEETRLTPQLLEQQLATIARRADGRIRGLASLFIEGTLLGGAPRLGVRPDDPNDLIPHERRRDLRGQRSIFAWLDHTDVKEDSTLDTWRADPKDPARHYVVHYLLDFNSALGAQAKVERRYSEGYEYIVQPEILLQSLLSLGLAPRAWEGREDPWVPGVGTFEHAPYHPAKWRPHTFAQTPIILADRFDQFWGAKILIRFTREQLAAAVETARYSDPRAAAYVLDTLIARQRKTARYWFRQVAPIDAPTVTATSQAARLCFTDLALRYQLEAQATTYTVIAHDVAGRELAGRPAARASATGEVCVHGVPVAPSADGYTVLRVVSSRAVPETEIHVARAPTTGQLQVIGIVRR